MNIQNLEFPDSCPINCPKNGEISKYGQNAICRYCPVFCCYLNPADSINDEPWRLIEPNDFRRDWLEEWYEFFQTGKEPELRFEIKKKE